MSQLPKNENGPETQARARTDEGTKHSFWLTGIGGFVLGALTVIIVLLLTRRAGDQMEPGIKNRPVPNTVQSNAPSQAGASQENSNEEQPSGE